MGFLLLGGMVLLMGVLNKVEVFREANKALIGLKLPIGIVVFFVGLASLGKFVFAGIMGLIAGVLLIMDLLKLIPSAVEPMENVDVALTSFQIPIGILTVIAAIIGLFVGG